MAITRIKVLDANSNINVASINVSSNIYANNSITSNSLYITSNTTTGTITRVEYNVPHVFMLMGA